MDGTDKNITIGVAVITHQSKAHLQHCLPHYINSSLKPRVLVVNSSSNDGTVEEAERLGAETLVIPRKEFNHGSTREKARKVLNTDIVLMTTPDAYPLDASVLEKLISPLVKGEASIAYARQLPHQGADIFEAFPRHFNYPQTSQIRGIGDIEKYGVYTFFCSDSCAAYKNSALDEIGGFRSVLTAEDYLATAMLLMKGHKIAYVAEAQVRHSHRYSLWQEFKRYFDTGYAQRENQRHLKSVGPAEARGRDFLNNLLKEVSQKRPLWLPYAVMQTGFKWVGYRLGFFCKGAPLWLKRSLSSQDYYWSSWDYLGKPN